MHQLKIEELQADAAEYKRQIEVAEYYIAHYKALHQRVYGAQAKLDCLDGLDRANELHDAATNNLHAVEQEIEYLFDAEQQDREELAAYGSLTVDMRSAA